MSTAPRGKLLEQRFQQFKLARKAAPDAPKLVDHIILAEFDIDTGSTVRHKYPCPVPGYKDDWFAEYMLPEGAHNHSLDWTVMFLNKGKHALEEGEGESAMSAETAEAPFLYCINLVRKKDDPTVRRGAVVKAMAVCSRYHFIEMFRPLLIIALDQYYQSTDPAVLASLYDAINAADMGALPRPLPWERRLMRRGVCGRPLGSVPAEHLPQKWTHAMSFEYGTQKVTLLQGLCHINMSYCIQSCMLC
jgi:Docking domain of Afi1 for Arf3 in vesicle trafficking